MRGTRTGARALAGLGLALGLGTLGAAAMARPAVGRGAPTGNAAARAPSSAAQLQQAPPAPPAQPASTNPPYDGRFTFARLRFAARGGGGYDFMGRADNKWDHDWPQAERNLMRILREVSTLRPRVEQGVVLAADDPALFRHPVAYLCEPGFWSPTDAEALALGAYLRKGGFLIFDDFFGRHWDSFEAGVRRVMPEARLVRLEPTHPIFDAFFHIEQPDNGVVGRRGFAEFWGVFEDNDPAKRLLLIANYNNDIGESWEWSDTGFMPVDVTSVAYKLGVNYVMYGMTR
jgi:hypothetical protein